LWLGLQLIEAGYHFQQHDLPATIFKCFLNARKSSIEITPPMPPSPSFRNTRRFGFANKLGENGVIDSWGSLIEVPR
jgi:hypothetical protein